MSTPFHRLALLALTAALILPASLVDARERRVVRSPSPDIAAAQLEDNDTLRRTLATQASDRTSPGHRAPKSK